MLHISENRYGQIAIEYAGGNGRSLYTAEGRESGILNETLDRFLFDSDAIYDGHTSVANSFRVIDRLGDAAVSDNALAIEYFSEEYGVDPDLVRAVVYLENAHGAIRGLVSEMFGRQPTSTLPANIQVERWGDLLPELDAVNNPVDNIHLMVALLAEIQERLENPTPAAIATLHNQLSADMITQFGLTVVDYMVSQPWTDNVDAYVLETIDAWRELELYYEGIGEYGLSASARAEAHALKSARAARMREESSLGEMREKGYNDFPLDQKDVGELDPEPDHRGKNGLTPPEGPTKEHPKGPVGPRPIILDLDGLGITVTELSQSTQFVDGGDGLEHRTAWAGVGDGVLFFDVGGDGAITEQREYVFTEWNPTAGSDLEALRSYFDTNGDGKLTSAGSARSQFKAMFTNADGTTTAKLGIGGIGLMGDAASIELPDGILMSEPTSYTKKELTHSAGGMSTDMYTYL